MRAPPKDRNAREQVVGEPSECHAKSGTQDASAVGSVSSPSTDTVGVVAATITRSFMDGAVADGKPMAPIVAANSSESKRQPMKLVNHSLSLPSRATKQDEALSSAREDERPSQKYKVHLSRLHCQKCLQSHHVPILHVHVETGGNPRSTSRRRDHLSKYDYRSNRCHKCKVPIESAVHTYNNRSDLLCNVQSHFKAAKHASLALTV